MPQAATLLRRVRGLSPFGPIFDKELRATARRKRTYVLRFVYLGVLLLVLLFVHTVMRMESVQRGEGVARRSMQMSVMGMVFFAVFSFFTLGSMALLGPILTATAVNSERLHKTLHTLLMTPITAWQIIWGKLFSRLLIALTLIGLSLPVLAVVRLLGGMELQQMFASLALCVSTVIFGAAVGLFFSTLMNRAYAVILLSYAALGFLWVLGPLMVGLVCAAMDVRDMETFKFLANVFQVSNPGMTMMLVAAPFGPPGFPILDWWWCALAHLSAAGLLVLWCAAILRRMARKESEGAGAAAPLPPVAALAQAAPAPAEAEPSPAEPPLPAGGNGRVAELTTAGPPPIPYAGVPAAVGREVSDNPVLWREVRRPLLGKVWQRVLAALVVLGTLGIIYIALASENDLGDDETQAVFAVVFCGALTLLGCVVSATAIAQEKESDTWTLLLASPISARAIVLGKLAGLLRRLLWPALLIVAHLLLFTLGGVLSWTTFFICIWLILAGNVIWLATGVYWSLRLPSVTFAVILNLLGPIIVYAIVPAVLGISSAFIQDEGPRMDAVGNYRPPPPNWAEVVAYYAPYGYIVMAIDDLRPTGTWPRSIDYAWNQRWATEDFIAMAMLCGAGYLAASALVVGWTIRRFNAIVGRAEQTEPLGPGPESPKTV